MHWLASLLSVTAILMLGQAQAGASVLTNAAWYQVVQGVPMTRTYGQLSADGWLFETSITVTLSYPFFSSSIFVPKTPNGSLDLAIHITQGGPQAITATANMANGTPGIPGTVIVRTALHVAMGLNQSMFKVGANTLVAVPLSVGKAGQVANTFTVIGQLHGITLGFYAWTPNPLVFTGLTTKGVALPDVSAAGSFGLTGHGGGTVTLVAPSKVSIDGSLLQRRTASFTKLVLSSPLENTPEPGALMLLAGGALALAWAARRAKR